MCGSRPGNSPALLSLTSRSPQYTPHNSAASELRSGAEKNKYKTTSFFLREACQKKSAEFGSLAQIGREGEKQNPNLYASKFGLKIIG